jgi:hypothetical protein
MNQDQFAYWLQGFVEMNGGKEPTKAQWKMIKDHLQLCFVKGGVSIPQGQYRYPVHMQPWLTPVIRGGYGGQGGGGGC